MMDRLDKKGLVERIRGTVDRRQVHCTLSQAGQDLLAKLDPCVAAFDRRIGLAVGDEGHNALLEILGRIRDELHT